MRKLHLGCGGLIIPGWENSDKDGKGDSPAVDISQPLPFRNDSIDRIFLEHVLEHVTHPEGYRFLREALRVLVPGGRIRICVPSLPKIWESFDNAYGDQIVAAIGVHGFRGIVENIVLHWGHKAVYDYDILSFMMLGAGFDRVEYLEPRVTSDQEFRMSGGVEAVDSHYFAIGVEANKIETIAVEGMRP
jgi:predicted SAM-dependent methyltransferase